MIAQYIVFHVNEETGTRWYLKDDGPGTMYAWTDRANEATPLARQAVVRICSREKGVWGFKRVK